MTLWRWCKRRVPIWLFGVWVSTGTTKLYTEFLFLEWRTAAMKSKGLKRHGPPCEKCTAGVESDPRVRDSRRISPEPAVREMRSAPVDKGYRLESIALRAKVGDGTNLQSAKDESIVIVRCRCVVLKKSDEPSLPSCEYDQSSPKTGHRQVPASVDRRHHQFGERTRLGSSVDGITRRTGARQFEGIATPRRPERPGPFGPTRGVKTASG